jgi:hypothetical protein
MDKWEIKIKKILDWHVLWELKPFIDHSGKLKN